jgi:hypothetical protein
LKGGYRLITPEKLDVPDVVIPVFERDVCKAKYLAKSLAVHDPQQRLGTIILMWVSFKSSEQYLADVNDINESLSGNHKVRFIDFSPELNSQSMNGWYAQQILKLKISSIVSSKYYVVLDAKNALLKDVDAQTFFSWCHQGTMMGAYKASEIPEPHINWYRESARALGVAPPEEGLWPSSITPVVIHKETVQDMLKSLGEGNSIHKLCDGPLCGLLGARGHHGFGASEFTLYTLFARSRSDFDRIHFISDVRSSTLTQRWAVALWRGTSQNHASIANINRLKCQQIANGKAVPLMFGSQPGVLEAMDENQRTDTTALLVQIYTHAKLHDPKATSTQELLDCAIGTFTTRLQQ